MSPTPDMTAEEFTQSRGWGQQEGDARGPGSSVSPSSSSVLDGVAQRKRMILPSFVTRASFPCLAGRVSSSAEGDSSRSSSVEHEH